MTLHDTSFADGRGAHWRRRVLRAAVWVDWSVCAVSYGIMLIGVESVLITGPIILLMGSALLVTGLVTRWSPGFWIGLSNCAVCAVFFGVVRAFDWLPADADGPFALMGAVYILGLFPLVLYAYGHASQSGPECCQSCGYLLIGLPEPRCPECGTPFDPVAVAHAVRMPAGGPAQQGRHSE